MSTVGYYSDILKKSREVFLLDQSQIDVLARYVEELEERKVKSIYRKLFEAEIERVNLFIIKNQETIKEFKNKVA